MIITTMLKNFLYYLFSIFLLWTINYVFSSDYTQPESYNNIEELTDDIDSYIISQIDQTVDERYNPFTFSNFRVAYDVILKSDQDRKEKWIEYFKKNGINKDSIQSAINCRIKEYNNSHKEKLSTVKVNNFDVINNKTYESIIMRERHEVIGSILIIIIGTISSTV